MTSTVTPNTSDSSFDAFLSRVAHVPDVPIATFTPGSHVVPGLTLVRKIGDGGMGSVWVARHRAFGKLVAVKLLKRHGERCVYEAASLERLRHPHVVRCFDFGTTADGLAFLVMELLEGETLASRIARLGPLDAAETCELVEQIGDALAAVHALGLVHQDVKPSNIFLVAGERIDARLIDFGVTRPAPSLFAAEAGPSRFAGTLAYMSPEQLLRGEMDGRSDLWALAAVAHVALTGRRPFVGESAAAIAAAIGAQRIEPLRALRPDLPDALDRWLARALHPDATERFATARELSLALRRASTLALFPRSTPAPSPPRAGVHEPLGHLSLALAALIAVAFLLAL